MHPIASTFQITCILKIDSEKGQFCTFILDLMLIFFYLKFMFFEHLIAI